MFIQIGVELNVNLHNVRRIVLLGCTVFVIGLLSIDRLGHIKSSRESYLRSRLPNGTDDEIYSSCHIPYDDTRCSLQPTNDNTSNDCLTDADAMTGHILPLVLFVMEVFLTRDLFALNGKHSYILANILWLVSLFIFIIIAIAVHGSICYHTYATFAISLTGCLLGGFVLHLVVQSSKKYPFDTRYAGSEDTTVSTTNHDAEMLEEVAVM